MSTQEQSFVDSCLNGDALLEEIDDYIDRWHNGKSTEQLHEFLGFTEEEYAIFVQNPNALKQILFSRNFNIPLTAFTKESLIAKTRVVTVGEAKKLGIWSAYCERKGISEGNLEKLGVNSDTLFGIDEDFFNK